MTRTEGQTSTREYWDNRKAEQQANAAAATERQALVNTTNLTTLTDNELDTYKQHWLAARERLPYTGPEATMLADKIATAEEHLVAAEAEQQRRAEAEWDIETTRTRRAELNAWATAKRRTMLDLQRKEREQGWLADDLKAAIQRHGL